ncbi:hypothetical protein BJY01DRAFT_262888 [Aspergillus pseudoustus]|uniref:NAD(P)-binding protein n=1 Tax=Aspergillus pseudoustus TaxID=1810923 RepID=A0ABR4K648_9EURO
MAAQRVALILGAGPNVGASVAAALASAGYKVVVASRRGTGATTPEGYLSLQADFSKPESIPRVFDATKAAFNNAPNVVVYNAVSLTAPPDSNSALSIPVSSFEADLNVNTVSPYLAAQEAVKRWEALPGDLKKTFIYTGNGLNTAQLPNAAMLNLGVGKSASAYWLAVADINYASRGYRFFFADERTADGNFVYHDISGEAAAEFYTQLVRHEGYVPWQATFVKGKGYVKFH